MTLNRTPPMSDDLAGIYIEPFDSLDPTGRWKVFEWPSTDLLFIKPSREEAERAGQGIANTERLEYKGRWEGWW